MSRVGLIGERRTVASLSWHCSWQAASSAVPRPPPTLTRIAGFVRLYIQAEDRPRMIARLGPFERRTLMLRSGTLPPGDRRARLLVLPVGAPTIVAGVDRNWSTIVSEPYPVRDLLAHRWIFSGSRIVAARGVFRDQDRP